MSTEARPILIGVDRLLGVPGRFSVFQCPNCMAGHTAPPASASELASYYVPGYASHEQVSESRISRLALLAKRVHVRAILRSLPLESALLGGTGTALDVGCGRGDLAAGLVRLAWRVSGVEVSRQAAEIARSRGVVIEGETLSSATLPSETYDLVIFRHSLEHLPDPVANLRRANAAMRHGGRLVVSVPNFDSWQRRLFGSRWFHLDVPRHRFHFTPIALATAVQSAGFSICETSTSTSALGLPSSIQYLLLGRCIAARGLPFRVAVLACWLSFPLTWTIDRIGGGGDTLHVIARRE